MRRLTARLLGAFGRDLRHLTFLTPPPFRASLRLFRIPSYTCNKFTRGANINMSAERAASPKRARAEEDSKDYRPIEPMVARRLPPFNTREYFLDSYWLEHCRSYDEPMMREPFDSTGDALCDAVIARDVAAIRSLIQSGVSPNSRATDGWPALAIACDQRLHGCVAALLALNADPNICVSTDGLGGSPLSIAASRGNMECLRLVISAGAYIDSVRKEDGTTPLYMACQEMHVELVDELVDSRADPNMAAHDGMTPLAALMHAKAPARLKPNQSEDRDVCVYILLAEGGALMNYQCPETDLGGYKAHLALPLVHACACSKANHIRPPCVKLLLDSGARLEYAGPARGYPCREGKTVDVNAVCVLLHLLSSADGEPKDCVTPGIFSLIRAADAATRLGIPLSSCSGKLSLIDLKSRAEINGLPVQLMFYDLLTGRFAVRVTPPGQDKEEQILVQASNLQHEGQALYAKSFEQLAVAWRALGPAKEPFALETPDEETWQNMNKWADKCVGRANLGGDEVYAIQVKLSDTGISVTRVIREHLGEKEGVYRNDQRPSDDGFSHVERVIREHLGEEAAGVYRSNEQPVGCGSSDPGATNDASMEDASFSTNSPLLTITKHSRKRIDERPIRGVHRVDPPPPHPGPSGPSTEPRAEAAVDRGPSTEPQVEAAACPGPSTEPDIPTSMDIDQLEFPVG